MEPGIAPKRRGRPPAPLKIPAKAPEVEASQEEPDDVEIARPAMRPGLRPDMRKEDSRSAAARRAAEILGNLSGSLDDAGVDEFYAPPPPDGWTYEWKTKSVLNQEQYSYQTGLKRTGWTEVPTSRHPEMMPEGGAWPIIERKGMVLMERPKVITEKVRSMELRKASDQMRAKKEQLGQKREGIGADSLDKAPAPKVRNSYAPVQVPED